MHGGGGSGGDHDGGGGGGGGGDDDGGGGGGGGSGGDGVCHRVCVWGGGTSRARFDSIAGGLLLRCFLV